MSKYIRARESRNPIILLLNIPKRSSILHFSDQQSPSSKSSRNEAARFPIQNETNSPHKMTKQQAFNKFEWRTIFLNVARNTIIKHKFKQYPCFIMMKKNEKKKKIGLT